MTQQLQARSICPMQVVEHDEHWRLFRRRREKLGGALQEQQPFHLRIRYPLSVRSDFRNETGKRPSLGCP